VSPRNDQLILYSTIPEIAMRTMASPSSTIRIFIAEVEALIRKSRTYLGEREDVDSGV
jgi:hypothetical protein